MKNKLTAIITALLSVFILAVLPVAEESIPDSTDTKAPIPIYLTEAPASADGTVTDNEYGEAIAQISEGTHSATIYMCYDSTNIYYAVTATCAAPHVAYNEGEHFIFNAHHLMTCIIPDDTSRKDGEAFLYPDGDSFNWGTVNSKNLCCEFTAIYSSKNNKQEIADHFGKASEQITYSATSADGIDTYEFVIPWSAMKNSVVTAPLTGEEGTVFGFDCNIGLSDIGEGYDDNNSGDYLFLGSCYAGNTKNLRGTAKIVCVGEFTPPAEESSAPVESSDSISEASNESTSVSTGDDGNTPFIVIGIIALIAAIALVVTKRK